MSNKLLVASGLAAALAWGAGAANATVTATFDSTNEGWSVGSMDGVANITGAANWHTGGYLQTLDVAAEVAFFASNGFLGNQSSAYGGTLSYDTSDTENDGVLYSAVVLYGAGQAISIGSLPPSISLLGSHFSFNLTETGFSHYTGGGIQGANDVTQAEFQAVLANLTAIAFHADWKSGGDDSALDNVVFGNANGGGAVPEPTSWALMILGFGGVGAAVRRRRSGTALA